MTSQAYLSELFSLDGRVAVVTGGSSGIGRAIAGHDPDLLAPQLLTQGTIPRWHPDGRGRFPRAGSTSGWRSWRTA